MLLQSPTYITLTTSSTYIPFMTKREAIGASFAACLAEHIQRSSTGASIQLLLPVWTRVVPRQGDSTRYQYLHPPRTSNIKFTKHDAWDGRNIRCRTWNFDLPGEAKANNWWQSLHVDAGGNRPAASNLLVHRSSQREMLGIFWEGTLDNNHYIIQKKLPIYIPW